MRKGLLILISCMIFSTSLMAERYQTDYFRKDGGVTRVTTKTESLTADEYRREQKSNLLWSILALPFIILLAARGNN